MIDGGDGNDLIDGWIGGDLIFTGAGRDFVGFTFSDDLNHGHDIVESFDIAMDLFIIQTASGNTFDQNTDLVQTADGGPCFA